MSGRSSKVPSYRLHKQSGQAIVTLSDGLGSRRDVLLGPYGTPTSRAEYARVIAEWEASGRRSPAAASANAALSVNEVILAYWSHVQNYYRHPDGRPTSEVENIRQALRFLKELYGHAIAGNFDSLALEAVRNRMIRQGRCRKLVNRDVSRLKSMFKWAVARQLVPLAVYQTLTTVEGLRAGRTEAHERDPVQPVPVEFVEETLPKLLPQTAAMVQLQLITGMRPGEVVGMRGIDLDTSGPIWFYKPGSDQGPHGQHKTAWRGKSRIIALGPKAQEVLKPWLRLNVMEHLFQPKEGVAWRQAQLRKRTPDAAHERARKNRKRQPGDRYTVKSYRKAVVWAARKAGVPKWFPAQLRHTYATQVRHRYGLEAAQVALGHAKADVTQIYAEANQAEAARIAAEVG
jgi:integrase